MRARRQVALLALTIAAFVAGTTCGLAQSGVTLGHDPSDQTLEIAPRIAPPVPDAAPSSTPDATPPPVGADGASQQAQAAIHPYLGIAVQTIYSNDRPGGLVSGLEVVSVDRNSPADVAGLRGRTKMTSIGESGATASALVPPLNLLMMPLLKKSGSLGEGGDLIIGIDDRRVTNDFDLQSELESLKPGGVIYLTITRALADGSHQTLKLPIKLGDATQAMATAGADDNSAPSAGAPAKHP